MGQFAQNIIDLIGKISTKFGTGVLVNDLMLFLLLLGFLAFLFAIAAYRHTYNLKTPPGIERVNMIAGKVEKVEMNVGEFRIETVRNLELFRGDLGYIKQELTQMSAMLKILAKGGSANVNANLAETEEFNRPETITHDQSWGTAEEEHLPENPMSPDHSKKKA
jgi:hypothetical protein